MSVVTMAPVRRPPHDPLSLLLDAATGWRVCAAQGVEPTVVVAGGALRLARDPAGLRPMTDPAGTFGGLRLPANVAVAEDGTIWLLDAATGRLLRFDPCTCRFVEVRAVDGALGPIAVRGNRLFAATEGWLAVLALPTAQMEGRWRPTTAPSGPWQPRGVVVDAHRQVRVADPANGMVHTFAWVGRYLGATAGTGAADRLAVALDGTVFAASPVEALRLDGDAVGPACCPAEDLAEGFAPLPFELDASGNLVLAPLCTPDAGVTAADAYDLAGNPTAPVPWPAVHPFRTEGSVVLGPLDSLIETCIWHRVVLHGAIPAGCTVTVRTLTAHDVLDGADVPAPADPRWSTGITVTGPTPDGGDCLVDSDPGRFCWVHLDLTGTGAAGAVLTGVEVEFPRISLRRYLPAVYGEDRDAASFTDRFLALFDRELRSTEARIDALPAALDPGATPWLDWLSRWVGLAQDPRLPEATRRRLLGASARLYDTRGTTVGLRELLIIVLGLDEVAVRTRCWEPPPLILEHFRLRRWLRNGVSRIGADAMVWGAAIANRSRLGLGATVGVTQLKTSQDPLRDPFHVYAHKYTVFLPASAGRTPQQRKVVDGLLRFATPAHTAGDVRYVEPRFRIGLQSSLGLDAVVARIPSGITVGGTALGTAVLTGNDAHLGAPRRLGSTSVLGGQP
ncbi:phage tail protein [Xylanimonas cellulosilytica DSM 15894]|uniref:Phage tail protein n=1 Tax=Xylanimonas cellulosilytica (strain DSM 15894 / JCM 12276 / CECT 5975 / KCTC 9989 / LMG 20990 / NBRC 107835 / XIL07) TaxID=446471 RepID=D1BTI9_XYLCX|nr:phage tail protein [Xylanimonas cellulosilytica]ACZ30968.1 phage tail protein [Xylanimonas cellulosilytica DSM 15894]